MICKQCGRPIKDGMRFCIFCGSPAYEMPKTESADPQTARYSGGETQIGTGKKTCPGCGLQIDADKKYCPRCGKPQTAQRPPEPDGWVCGSCGATNAQEMRFCVMCGEPNGAQKHACEPDDGWVCGYCGATNAPEMRYCMSCGTPRAQQAAAEPEDGRVCVSCGAQEPYAVVGDHRPQDDDPERSDKKGSGAWIPILIVMAILAAAAVAAAFLLHRCVLCEKIFVGEPYPLIRMTDAGKETLEVCRECYDKYGIPEDEKPTTVTAQQTQAPVTTTANAAQPNSSFSSLSAQDVRLLNLFLSNFSELGILEINAAQTEQVLNFAVEHELVNYNNAQTLSPDKQFIAWNADAGQNSIYTVAVSEQFVQKRVGRFFGDDVPNRTTGRFYYNDAQYFALKDYRGAHPQFSSVYDFADNGDGTVTVYFKIFSAKETGTDGFPKSEAYDGPAADKDAAKYTAVGSGQAVLKKADAGENQAPYRVISIRPD